MATGYLIFVDQPTALARSRTEVLARGCKPGDATQFWWEVEQHPTIPGSYLMLLDDSRPAFAKATLSAAEQLQVQADPLVLSALASASVQVGT